MHGTGRCKARDAVQWQQRKRSFQHYVQDAACVGGRGGAVVGNEEEMGDGVGNHQVREKREEMGLAHLRFGC